MSPTDPPTDDPGAADTFDPFDEFDVPGSPELEEYLRSPEHQQFNVLLRDLVVSAGKQLHGQQVEGCGCGHPWIEHKVRWGCQMTACPCREPRLVHLMHQLD